MSAMRHTTVAIGGSAGSLPVLCELLGGLDTATELSLVLCLHTSARDTSMLCRMLGRYSALPVIEAEIDTPVAAATVHVASGDYHLLVERDRTFALCAGPRVQYARPSIDVLFESMAEAYRGRLVGMLLSGANGDGASGLYKIHRSGGLTLVQDPDTAEAPNMPRAALGLFAPDRREQPAQLKASLAGIADRARRSHE